MTCRHAMPLLADYLAGAVVTEEAQQIRTHLKDCPDCRLVVSSAMKTLRKFFGERAPRAEQRTAA